MISYVLSRAFAYGIKSKERLPLIVYKNKPSKIHFEHFMDNVQDQKIKYLHLKYLFASNADSPADLIQKLVWLREQNAITDEEFEKLKADVISQTGWAIIKPLTMN